MQKHSQESCLGSFHHDTLQTSMPLPAAVAPQHKLSTGPSASAKQGNVQNLCPPAADSSARTPPTSGGDRGSGSGQRSAVEAIGNIYSPIAWLPLGYKPGAGDGVASPGSREV
jgi:hypothetical protein